jgi:hypothetical protein
MRKTMLCLVLLALVLVGPTFAANTSSIFKDQQDGSGFNVFFGAGYGADIGMEMIFMKLPIADIFTLDLGGIAWADIGFWGAFDIGAGAGISAHVGFNIPFAFVTGEEFRQAFGLAVGIPGFGYGFGLGFAYMEDVILYTNILPKNMGIRFGWTSARNASGGGIGLNIKL